MLGFQDTAIEIAGGLKLNFLLFITCVRRLLLSTGTSRKIAAEELEALTNKPFSVESCQAHSTKNTAIAEKSIYQEVVRANLSPG